MCKVAITRDELTTKVFAAGPRASSLVDSGTADSQLAASVLRKTSDELEPAFALVHPGTAEDSDDACDIPRLP